jgi:hypothetical protein
VVSDGFYATKYKHTIGIYPLTTPGKNPDLEIFKFKLGNQHESFVLEVEGREVIRNHGLNEA